MSKRIVISQPMLFPWSGMFEQILLADIYVHYTDVAFSKGSRVNRVQIKGKNGKTWMTIPIDRQHLGQTIGSLRYSGISWKQSHYDMFKTHYHVSPHFDDALDLMNAAYSSDTGKLVDIVIPSIQNTCEYLNIPYDKKFIDATSLPVNGTGSQRVLDIVKHLDGDTYITGHGARNYLDHHAFEKAGIRVEYMDYSLTEYPQLHGEFDPYVSILDMIANTGKSATDYLRPHTIYWKDFING